MQRNNAIFIGIGALVFILALGALGEAYSIQYYKFFGKWWMEAEREVYEENKHHVDSKLDTLRDRWMSYKEADDASEKETICLTVEQEFEDFDADNVEIDEMRQFLITIQKEGC